MPPAHSPVEASTSFMFVAPKQFAGAAPNSCRLLIASTVLFCFVAFSIVTLLAISSSYSGSFPYLFLLPWIIVLAMVFLTPTFISLKRGNFTLCDPLAFATWSYFFPTFVVGGLMLVMGYSQPSYLDFIDDPLINLPYTIFLTMLAFVGLAIGYYCPIGRRFGDKFESFLPKRDYNIDAVLGAGVFLLAVGTAATFFGISKGVGGYQKVSTSDTFDGIIFMATLFWMQGSFLLWYWVSKRRHIDFTTSLVAGFVILVAVFRAVYSGSRGAFLQFLLVAILAFLFSKRTVTLRGKVLILFLVPLSLIIGMIFATTFRSVKGSEARESIDRYSESVLATFDQLGSTNVEQSVAMGLLTTAERIDTFSQLAVVVSNYERFGPYEELYGLDNNIYKDLTSFFVPRIIWSEKPVASDARRFSALYFDYGDNSFAISLTGDLIRNFGPLGIPIGMFAFGILLRTAYRTFAENNLTCVRRVTVYTMFLMSVNYETFYGFLAPYLLKVILVASFGIFIFHLIAGLQGFKKRAIRIEA